MHERAVFVVVLHARPQPLQFVIVVIGVSQPFACRLFKQSAKPPTHAPLHVPPPHVRVAMFTPEQTTLQPPQLFGSVDVLMLQPFCCFVLSQFA